MRGKLTLAHRARVCVGHTGSMRRLSSRALVLNAGSSSLKYGLFTVGAGRSSGVALVASGLVERIGSTHGAITHRSHNDPGSSQNESELSLPDHAAGLARVIPLLTADRMPIAVVGHRVVHGGTDFTTPTLITDSVEAAIEKWSALAPLHNPPNLTGIRTARAAFPDAKHVAVFDTAFHASMEPSSYRYAIPKALYEEHAIRKYGFHGSSYTYLLSATAAHLGKAATDINLIILHLGNGASMACIKRGVCVDTTMGLTPLEGLVMGTRSGDLDPGVLFHLCRNLSLSPADVDTLLNKQSGLQGVCGQSDLRTIKDLAASGNADSELALEMFAERVRKYLGAFLVKLGGQVDGIVFSGGIGENDAAMRARICAGLRPLGIQVDDRKNEEAVGVAEIHHGLAATKLLVIPTDEERSIALQSAQVAGLAATAPTSHELREMARQVALKPKNAPRQAPDDEATASKLTQGHTDLKEGKAQPPGGVPEAKDGRIQLHTETIAPLPGAVYVSRSDMLQEVGLAYAILPRAPRLGYFRPFATGVDDLAVSLMRKRFQLRQDPSLMFGVTVAEAADLIAHGREDEMLDKILTKYLAYQHDKDFTIVSSAELPEIHDFWARRTAQAMNIPCVLYVPADHVPGLALFKTAFDRDNVRLVGTVVSNLPAGEAYRDASLAMYDEIKEMGITPLALFPERPRLQSHTLAEMAHSLKARVLFTAPRGAGAEVHHTKVVESLSDVTSADTDLSKCLVIHSAERVDLLMSLLCLAHSTAFRAPAGILLTGARSLPPHLDALLRGLGDAHKDPAAAASAPIPVLATDSETFDVAKAMAVMQSIVLPSSNLKIDEMQVLLTDERAPTPRFAQELRSTHVLVLLMC